MRKILLLAFLVFLFALPSGLAQSSLSVGQNGTETLINPGSDYSVIYVGPNSAYSSNQLIFTNYNWSVTEGLYNGYLSSSTGNEILTYNSSFTIGVDNAEAFAVGYYSSGNFMQLSGSTATCSNFCEIGWGASRNTLVLTNGSTWSNLLTVYIGGNANCNSNSLAVTAGSVFNSTEATVLGSGGSSNSLIISGSGSAFNESNSLSVGAGIAGYTTDYNSVLVSDDGVLNIGLACNIGYNGANYNSMIISNGGTVNISNSSTNSMLSIGYDSAENGIIITGTNSKLQVNGMIAIGHGTSSGYSVSNNYLYLTNGGQVNVRGNVLLGYSGSSSNNIQITEGTMNINGSLLLGYSNSAHNNIFSVNGSNSVLNCTGTNIVNLIVGYDGYENQFLVTNRGTVSAVGAIIGANSGANGNNMTVDGTSVTLTGTNYYSFIIGGYGSSNTFLLTNEGTVSAVSTIIGANSGANGNNMTVDGSSLILSGTNYYSFIVGGYGSSNTLLLTNGAVFSDYYGVIGYGGSNNSALVCDSSWTNNQNFYIGFTGNNNSLIISNGGKVIVTGTASGASPFGSSYIGLSSSSNSVIVTGTNSLFSNSGSLFIGNIGSYNSLLITNGGEVIDFNTITYTTSTNGHGSVTTNYTTNFAGIIGWAAGYVGDSVTLSGSNAFWNNNGDIAVGYGGYGNSLIISNGTAVDSNAYVGYLTSASNNTVLVVGTNAFWTNKANLYIQNKNNKVIVAEDGTLVSSNIYIMTDSSLIISNSSSLAASEGLFISGGTLFSYGTNTISNTTVTLEGTGTDFSRLFVASGNLALSTLSWGANGFVGMQLGSGTLTATNITNAGGGGVFDFTGTSLNNNTNLLITYESNNIANYSVHGMSGINLTNNGTTISEYIATNAYFTSSVSIHQIDSLIVAGFTFEQATNIIDETGSIITTNNSDNATVILTNGATVFNNGTMSGNYLIISSGSTLGGNGTNNFTTTDDYGTTNNGTISPGNSPGNIHFIGGLYCGETSIILQEIAGANFNQYDHVTVTGKLALNGTLDIRFAGEAVGSPIYIPQYGEIFTNIIGATGGITGNFKQVLAPTNYRGRLLYVNNTANGISTQYLSAPSFYNVIDLLMAPSSYTLLSQDQNQYNVAKALDSFIPATSGDELTVSAALDFMAASQYPAAFTQIMPTLYQSLSTIAFNQANAQNMELIQRLWGARVAGSGFSMNGFGENFPLLQEQNPQQKKNDILRPGGSTPWGVFIDGNGIFSQANSGNALPAYNTESGGVTTGLTYQWNDHVVSGLYSGYQGNYTKYNGTATGNLIDNSVLFGLFGTYAPEKDKGFFVDGLIGGGYSGYTMQRYLNFGTSHIMIDRTATGNPGAGMLNTMLATGYDLKKGKWTYGPTMNLQYAYFGVPSFNETGAQSLDLQNVSWNTSSMIYSLGSHVAYRWEVNKNLAVVPQINMSWQHEFLQNSYDISANLGGINFNNSSSAPLRDTLYTGIGCSLELDKKWNASLFYNAAAGNLDLMSQNIFLSLGMQF